MRVVPLADRTGCYHLVHRADALRILVNSLGECLDIRTKLCHVNDLVYHADLRTVFRAGFIMIQLDHIVHLVDDGLHILASLACLHKLSGVHCVGSGLARHYIVFAGSGTDGVNVGVVALWSAQYIVGSSAGLTERNL